MNKSLAPIVMFVYKRPEHTYKCLVSLKNNLLANQSTLYIICDGKKPDASAEEILKIEETKKLIRQEQWCKEVIIIEREINQGLAASIEQGVTDLLNKHGKLIVLEDDLVLAKGFLKFMNEGLDAYEKIENVYSINGYMFPIKFNETSTVLLPYTSTWGWATWKDKWKIYSPEIKAEDKLALLNNKELKNKFNLGDLSYTDMLDYGKNSWGIKWYHSVFKKEGLNVFPSISLVDNIGRDGSGTNYGTEGLQTFFNENNTVEISLLTSINLKFLSLYTAFFKGSGKNILKRILNKLKK